MEITDDVREDIQQAAEDTQADEITALVAEALTSDWLRVASEALTDALAALDGQAITEETVAELSGALGASLGPGFAASQSGTASDGVRTAYQLGRDPGGERIDVLAGVRLNQTDRRALTATEEDLIYWIGRHYDRQVRERIRTAARDVIGDDGQGVGRFRAGEEFASRFGQEFEKSASYWELLANHSTTRSRTFGRLETMVEAGVDRYRVDAIRDRRTSDICKHLDGRTFAIEDAVAHRERLITADSPEAVKDVQPWLSGETIAAMGDAELEDRGILLPPFHAHCRTTIQAVL